MGANGQLDTDKFALGILQYRNTPCRFLGLSPAQILFARNIKDGLVGPKDHYILRPEWVLTREQRELAMARKHVKAREEWSQGSKQHSQLEVGANVLVQNQTGKKKNKWELSGTIVENCDFNSYPVKLDGSGRISKRRRQFLRLIKPFYNFDEKYKNAQARNKNKLSTAQLSSENEQHSNQKEGQGSHNQDVHDVQTRDVHDVQSRHVHEIPKIHTRSMRLKGGVRGSE